MAKKTKKTKKSKPKAISKNSGKKKFYITTAIDYVNAAPHCGHAFEKTLADVIARWQRLQGNEVFFMTGVDENAQKNVHAAEQAGIPVNEFIDKNTALFQELCNKLNISHNKFIRTTADEHKKVVHEVLRKVIKNKDIYKGNYEGYYCSGCEAFITEKDLVDGKCPEHNRAPEFMKEEAYFFKLSKYQKQLIKFAETYIVPESKKNEILSRLKEPLKDVCISRKGAKWGVDFPDDPDYKIWVWVDALINYISGAKEQWPADLHVIGKGINWFHSVIWPALLMSAKIKLPKKLLVHGYLNLGGKKISKSLGNVIDPIELINKYGTDSVRYSLLKCSVFEDSDFTEEILIERHNKELANKLGNLISRATGLIDDTVDINVDTSHFVRDVSESIERFEVDKALTSIFAFIDMLNQFVQEKKIWETRDKKDIYELVTGIRAITVLLWPFIPDTSDKIAEQFGFKISLEDLKKPLKNIKITKSEILFKKIEIKENVFEKVEKEVKTIEKKVEKNISKILKSSKDKGHKPHTDMSISVNKLNKPVFMKPGAKQNSNSTHTDSDNKVNKSEIPGIINMANVQFSDWQKLELKVGKILEVEDIEGADKLYKLTIDIGKEKRVVCAGIKKYYKKEQLKGKLCVLFVNLEPRVMRGITSQGMILAAVNADESKVFLIQPDKDIEVGSRVS
jgi:methionyl-tRNA synthetase